MPSSSGLLRGRSDANITTAKFDKSHIQMSGWLTKQSDTLRAWRRRFFALSGDKLGVYTDENIQKSNPRTLFHVKEIHPLVSADHGILIVCHSGKEVKLAADTKVAYNAWFSLISASVGIKDPNANSESRTVVQATKEDPATFSKSGMGHYRFPEGNWTCFYLVLDKDILNCYESEDPNAMMELSGIVRSVKDWDGKKYGLIVGLNKSRKIELCFDSMEDKTGWLIAFEVSINYSIKQMRERRNQQQLAKQNSYKRSGSPDISSSGSVSSSRSTEEEKEDDGIWI